MLLHEPAHVPPAPPGHHDVEEHQRGPRLLELRERLITAVRHHHVISARGEIVSKKIGVVDVVIDDQQRRGVVLHGGVVLRKASQAYTRNCERGKTWAPFGLSNASRCGEKR